MIVKGLFWSFSQLALLIFYIFVVSYCIILFAENSEGNRYIIININTNKFLGKMVLFL